MINRLLKISVPVLIILSGLLGQPEIELIDLPSMQFPLGCNSDGSMVVGGSFGGQAFYWTAEDGEIYIGNGDAWSVSDNGLIAGEIDNSNGHKEAAIYNGTSWNFLGTVPGGGNCDAFLSSGLDITADGGLAVGMGWINCSVEAFTWTNETGIVQLGQYMGNSTKAQAVSDDGLLRGGWAQGTDRWSALWNAEGEMTLLGSAVAGQNGGEVMGINSDGSQVVGYCAAPAPSESEAYIWTEDGGFELLGVPSNAAQFDRSLATDISDDGIVVGQYLYSGLTDFRACIKPLDSDIMIDLKEYLISIGVEGIEDRTFNSCAFISGDGTTFGGYNQGPNGFAGYIIKLDNTIEAMPGDMNEDELVNVQDIVIAVNIILGVIEATPYHLVAGDVNEDGTVNILDVISIVNIIVNE